MKKIVIIATTLAVTAAVAFAGFKCAQCNGTGWKGQVKCLTCGGDGETGN